MRAPKYFLLFALSLSVILSACGDDSSSSSATPAASGGEVTDPNTDQLTTPTPIALTPTPISSSPTVDSVTDSATLESLSINQIKIKITDVETFKRMARNSDILAVNGVAGSVQDFGSAIRGGATACFVKLAQGIPQDDISPGTEFALLTKIEVVTPENGRILSMFFNLGVYEMACLKVTGNAFTVGEFRHAVQGIIDVEISTESVVLVPEVPQVPQLPPVQQVTEHCLDASGFLRVGAASLASAQCTGELVYLNASERANQPQAVSVCPVGTHVPSIRELARASQSLGARGILETRKIKRGRVPSGYSLISAVNADGTRDAFYFNPQRYRRPSGDLGNISFWSSSTTAADQTIPYYLNGVNGAVDFSRAADSRYAIQCVPGRQ